MIDALGHPLVKGTLVLTAGYWSTDRNVITKIIKANKKTIVVSVPAYIWDSTTRTYVYSEKIVRRRYNQALAIEQQLEYNKKHFPEYLV